MKQRSVPIGFSDLALIPNIRLDIRYASNRNFMGRVISGYGYPGAWLRESGADQLRRLSQELNDIGLGIHVWDAYRPRRATLEMAQWAKETEQEWLLEEGYLVWRSRHNMGGAIDLNFYELHSGRLLDMGTEWDHFSEASHVQSATGKIRENRLFVQRKMKQYGFLPYETEWWHFELPNATNFPLRDVPYGQFESEEDASICQ